MHQSGEVDQFDDGGQRRGAAIPVSGRLVGEEQKGWAEHLSPHLEKM